LDGELTFNSDNKWVVFLQCIRNTNKRFYDHDATVTVHYSWVRYAIQ